MDYFNSTVVCNRFTTSFLPFIKISYQPPSEIIYRFKYQCDGMYVKLSDDKSILGSLCRHAPIIWIRLLQTQESAIGEHLLNTNTLDSDKAQS